MKTSIFKKVSPPAQDTQLYSVTEPQHGSTATSDFIEVLATEQEAFLNNVSIELRGKLILFVGKVHRAVPNARW